MNTFVLIFWLYQPPGFGETFPSQIEVTKVEQLDEKTCNKSLSLILNKVSKSKVITAEGICIPINYERPIWK
jgi:hypothetical protein